MKKIFIVNLCLVYLFIFNAEKANGQSNPILGGFTAIENDNIVFLGWQIVAGATCNGIKIQRSTDSFNFSEIGFIPGICGNITTAQYYDFTDAQPIENKINYYRLELGNNGFSEILPVEIISIENGGNQIRPNPASVATRIYFENSTSQSFQLIVYDLNGKICKTLQTQSRFFNLETNDLSNGIYAFTISTNNNLPKTKGKLVVQH